MDKLLTATEACEMLGSMQINQILAQIQDASIRGFKLLEKSSYVASWSTFNHGPRLEAY